MAASIKLPREKRRWSQLGARQRGSKIATLLYRHSQEVVNVKGGKEVDGHSAHTAGGCEQTMSSPERHDMKKDGRGNDDDNL